MKVLTHLISIIYSPRSIGYLGAFAKIFEKNRRGELGNRACPFRTRTLASGAVFGYPDGQWVHVFAFMPKESQKCPRRS